MFPILTKYLFSVVLNTPTIRPTLIAKIKPKNEMIRVHFQAVNNQVK
jgi:hypothetical protein